MDGRVDLYPLILKWSCFSYWINLFKTLQNCLWYNVSKRVLSASRRRRRRPTRRRSRRSGSGGRRRTWTWRRTTRWPPSWVSQASARLRRATDAEEGSWPRPSPPQGGGASETVGSGWEEEEGGGPAVSLSWFRLQALILVVSSVVRQEVVLKGKLSGRRDQKLQNVPLKLIIWPPLF